MFTHTLLVAQKRRDPMWSPSLCSTHGPPWRLSASKREIHCPRLMVILLKLPKAISRRAGPSAQTLTWHRADTQQKLVGQMNIKIKHSGRQFFGPTEDIERNLYSAFHWLAACNYSGQILSHSSIIFIRSSSLRMTTAKGICASDVWQCCLVRRQVFIVISIVSIPGQSRQYQGTEYLEREVQRQTNKQIIKPLPGKSAVS